MTSYNNAGESSVSDSYDDFNPVDDGFRTMNSSNGELETTRDDASSDDIVRSGGTTLDKIDVLLSQDAAPIDPDLGLSVVQCENLADVGHAIKSVESPFVIQIKNIPVLREFIRRHGLFGVRIAALRNIPELVKDRLYEQSVWSLNSVDYPILLDRVQSVADATAARKRQDEVKKRMSLREKRRVTAEAGDDLGPQLGELTAARPRDEDDDQQFGEIHGS